MISVALCTYNGERFLREQLQSICTQSLPVDEVVIGDDRSCDNTIIIINSFKDKLPLRILDSSRHQGGKKNFLRTIYECKGDIIFLSDQDDIWNPNKVETIKNYFDTHGNVDAIFTDATLIDSDGKPLEGNRTLWDYFFDEISRKRCEMGFMIEEFCSSSHATGATMAFRKKLTSRFPNRDDIWHDELIARLAVSSHSLAYLPECLTRYRIHSSQQIGISPCKSNDGFQGDYRQPEMPFSIEDLFLTNEEDLKHIDFLKFRCRTKHQVFGWINAIVHLSSYKRFYKKHAFAFAMYDVFNSIKHTTKRIQRKIMLFFAYKGSGK